MLASRNTTGRPAGLSDGRRDRGVRQRHERHRPALLRSCRSVMTRTSGDLAPSAVRNAFDVLERGSSPRSWCARRGSAADRVCPARWGARQTSHMAGIPKAAQVESCGWSLRERSGGRYSVIWRRMRPLTSGPHVAPAGRSSNRGYVCLHESGERRRRARRQRTSARSSSSLARRIRWRSCTRHRRAAPRDRRAVRRVQLRQPERAGKWSIAQVLQHLADSDLVWGWRARLILAQDRPTITGYDQDLWAERLRYDEAEPADIARDVRRAAAREPAAARTCDRRRSRSASACTPSAARRASSTACGSTPATTSCTCGRSRESARPLPSRRPCGGCRGVADRILADQRSAWGEERRCRCSYRCARVPIWTNWSTAVGGVRHPRPAGGRRRLDGPGVRRPRRPLPRSRCRRRMHDDRPRRHRRDGRRAARRGFGGALPARSRTPQPEVRPDFRDSDRPRSRVSPRPQRPAGGRDSLVSARRPPCFRAAADRAASRRRLPRARRRARLSARRHRGDQQHLALHFPEARVRRARPSLLCRLPVRQPGVFASIAGHDGPVLLDREIG